MVERIRRIPGRFGLHKISVTVRVQTWSGQMVGEGTKTVVDTPLVDGAGYPPNVKQLSTKETVLSGGVLGDRVYEIGPITPPFPGGGIADFIMNPRRTADSTEVFYILEGEGLVDGGETFELMESNFEPSFHSTIKVKKVGKQS